MDKNALQIASKAFWLAAACNDTLEAYVKMAATNRLTIISNSPPPLRIDAASHVIDEAKATNPQPATTRLQFS